MRKSKMPIVGFLWLPNLIYEGIQRGANMMVPILLATLAIILTIFGIKYRKSYAGKLLIAIGLILWLVVGFVELLKHQ
jgi:galactitol-specific phosphotransferase system IIC component